MLVIDVAKDTLPTTSLDFTDGWDGNGPAVVITNSDPEPYWNRTKVLRGLEIAGPGREHMNSIGILLSGAAGVSIEDCAIHGFGVGLQFGDDTWGNSVTNTNIFRCHTALNYPRSKNSGEVVSFFGGALFNSVEAVRTSYGPSLQFFGTAFDYCIERTFIIEGGAEIGLHGCHIETGHIHQQENPIVEIGPGWNRFLMRGGTIWMSPKTWHGTFDGPVGPWLKNQGDLVYLDGVRIHNMRGKYFQEGEGKLVTRNLTVYGGNPPLHQRRWWFPWGPKLGHESFLDSLLWD